MDKKVIYQLEVKGEELESSYSLNQAKAFQLLTPKLEEISKSPILRQLIQEYQAGGNQLDPIENWFSAGSIFYFELGLELRITWAANSTLVEILS